MKRRFIIYRRKLGGVFYIEDTRTRKQESLGTKNRAEATSLLNARNESVRQPQLNLQIAKAYLAGTDSGVSKRTWQDAFNAIIENKTGTTKARWQRGARQKGFELIHPLIIVETQAEHLFNCLKAGTVSTNVLLRELHNFCISMNWLPWPIIPKRLWPKIEYKPKRAITADEHRMIIDRERNPELRSFYELCWHLGGSQSDIAHLQGEDIDYLRKAFSYSRLKTGNLGGMRIRPKAWEVILRRPRTGPLFPYLCSVREADRATEFNQRCVGLGIHGVTLHNYRYGWAERSADAGYPERYAQRVLGQNSKAVHRAYAKKARKQMPSLVEYEAAMQAAEESGKILVLNHEAEVPKVIRQGI